MYYVYFVFSETCPAGQQSMDNVECTPCPVDTFKDKYGRGKCLPCKSKTSTDRKTGSSVCIGNA